MSDDEQVPPHNHLYTGPRPDCPACAWHRQHTAKIRPKRYDDPAVPTLQLADPAPED